MNDYGTEDYVEKPEYRRKDTDEHAETDEDDAASTDRTEHEGLTTESAEHEGLTTDRTEHEGLTTDRTEHEALTTESAEPEPRVAEPSEPETPFAEPSEPETPFPEPTEPESELEPELERESELEPELEPEPGLAASEPLLTPTSAEAFLDRWSDVQTTFIEDPHRSVTEADALLTEVLTAYRDAVEQRREQISSAWSGNAADTEKMRLALLDYRNVITTMLPAHSEDGRAGAAA